MKTVPVITLPPWPPPAAERTTEGGDLWYVEEAMRVLLGWPSTA